MKKVTKNSKRIWTKEELTFAYYVSKYGNLNGLNMKKEEVVNYVIGDTTERSFDMQVANFNYLLGIGESQYTDYSQLMVEVVEDFKNTTVTQLRDLMVDYAASIDDKVEERRVKLANTEANSKVEELNKVANKNFEAKLKMFAKMGRKLTPLKI